MVKLKFAFLLLLLSLSNQIAIGQYIKKSSSDSLIKKILLLKSVELLRISEFTLEDHYCFTQKTDSVFIDSFIMPSYENYIFYKMKWNFESPTSCFFDEEDKRLIKMNSRINDVLFAVSNSCKYQCRIFRLKGFENEDLDELILDLKKNNFSRSEKNYLLYEIKKLE
jgi:hypothetical protein